MDHDPLLDLSEPYIQWFNSGKCPQSCVDPPTRLIVTTDTGEPLLCLRLTDKTHVYPVNILETEYDSVDQIEYAMVAPIGLKGPLNWNQYISKFAYA
jgi:hypothetical protein